MKKLVFAAVLCMALLCFAGCGQKAAVKKQAKTAADAFTSGDMSAINQVVFGFQEPELDPELLELLGEQPEQKEGILGDLFKQTEVTVKAIDEQTITYEITAPDMHHVFDGLIDNAEQITEDALIAYMEDYAAHAEKITTTVSVPYTLSDGEPTVNYRSPEFLNAITGGLGDAYRGLYQILFDSYLEGGQ